MRIAELTVFHVRIRLKKPIRHASQTRSDTDSIVARCVLDSGVVGWGEGLPREYVTGETIDTAFQQVHETDWRPQLAESFSNLTEAVALSGRISPLRPISGVRDCFGNSLRCALELSVLDAAARAEDVPLSHVTTLVPETIAIANPRSSVQYSGAITTSGKWGQRIKAWKMRLFGFHQVKVKVGASDVDDADALSRIRKILGPKVDLRLDANEAWTCENLEQKLAPLLPFDVTSLEQPVPHAEVEGLAKLRPQIPIPLMLDESLCSASDGQRAIEQGLCDLFNLRLSKCGGFVPSLRLAAMAHRAGLGYQMGCQVGETGILSAAGRHFATSVDQIRYLEGSYDNFLVKERLTKENLTFGYGGKAPVLTKPGLGIQIDEHQLQQVTQRSLQIVTW
ncbi:MAG: dipeptide epimerase [Planctomycetaceae bacterium]|nr:dipeptide epimerase [Planctomycetaceae bacterium]